jgi:hypothetical protein
MLGRDDEGLRTRRDFFLEQRLHFKYAYQSEQESFLSVLQILRYISILFF